jgi:hypothetical protein
MSPRKSKKIVQDFPDFESKPHWDKALHLAREELRQIEDRAKVLRESIPVFERLTKPPNLSANRANASKLPIPHEEIS